MIGLGYTTKIISVVSIFYSKKKKKKEDQRKKELHKIRKLKSVFCTCINIKTTIEWLVILLK